MQGGRERQAHTEGRSAEVNIPSCVAVSTVHCCEKAVAKMATRITRIVNMLMRYWLISYLLSVTGLESALVQGGIRISVPLAAYLCVQPC